MSVDAVAGDLGAVRAVEVDADPVDEELHAGPVVGRDVVVADDGADAGVDVHADAVVVHDVVAEVGTLGLDAEPDDVAGHVVVVDGGG